jgi:hypothetical protein
MAPGWTPTGASVSIEIPDFGQGDPSGADTFARYRYQARLTLFHWLGTLTPDGPLAVYAEHVEDILLHYTDRFLFIQVKTRVPTAGQWTAESMCASGGGIDSLCRAYAVARHAPCFFSLHIEGSTSPSSGTADFVRDCSAANSSLRTKIMGLLTEMLGEDATDDVLNDFLSRLTIVPNQPSQSDIDAKCFRALCRLVPTLTAEAAEELYQRLLGIVEDAQQALLAGLSVGATGIEFLQAQLIVLLAGGEAESAAIESKRLTQERLEELLIVTPSAVALLLIERVLDDRPLTALEEKLLAAGANDHVVLEARQLRAMAEPRRLELLSGPDHQLNQLDDVSNRVLLQARNIAQLCRTAGDPPNDLWARLVAEAGLENADQTGIFNHDRPSLLGLLCCLSDECKFAWQP